MKTKVIFVLDKSGSMWNLQEDVIGGFNTYIETLKKDDNEYLVTLTMFDTKVEVPYENSELKKVSNLDRHSYRPGGCTALLDAVGKAIPQDEEFRTIMVIMTDGYENSSVEYTKATIKKLIEDKEATGKFNVVYIGQHQDAWAQAGGMGIKQSQTISVPHTSRGTRTSYAGAAIGTQAYAKGETIETFVASVEEAVNNE